MARILEDYPFATTMAERPQNQSKYPYAEWFDGQIRELVRGEDFTIGPKSLRTGLMQKVRKMRAANQLPPGRLLLSTVLGANGREPDRMVVQYLRD